MAAPTWGVLVHPSKWNSVRGQQAWHEVSEKIKGYSCLLSVTRLLPHPAGGDRQCDVLSVIPFAGPSCTARYPPARRGGAESAKRRYNGVRCLFLMACGALRLTVPSESAI